MASEGTLNPGIVPDDFEAPILHRLLEQAGHDEWTSKAKEDMRAYRLGYPARPQVLRPQPKICTIYFVGPVDGPIKIGWASQVDRRVRDLRLANAFSLEVWATAEGPPALERLYHREFAAHRLHGEWFARHPDILNEIERLRVAA